MTTNTAFYQLNKFCQRLRPISSTSVLIASHTRCFRLSLWRLSVTRLSEANLSWENCWDVRSAVSHAPMETTLPKQRKCFGKPDLPALAAQEWARSDRIPI